MQARILPVMAAVATTPATAAYLHAGSRSCSVAFCPCDRAGTAIAACTQLYLLHAGLNPSHPSTCITEPNINDMHCAPCMQVMLASYPSWGLWCPNKPATAPSCTVHHVMFRSVRVTMYAGSHLTNSGICGFPPHQQQQHPGGGCPGPAGQPGEACKPPAGSTAAYCSGSPHSSPRAAFPGRRHPAELLPVPQVSHQSLP